MEGMEMLIKIGFIGNFNCGKIIMFNGFIGLL